MITAARDLPNRYNSLQELLTREDGAQSLMVYYAATRMDCFGSSYYSAQLISLEYLFTLPEILDKLSQKDKQQIVKKLLENYRHWFQLIGINCRLLSVMVWLMYDDMLPYYDQGFLSVIQLSNGIVKDSEKEIIPFAEKFILK